MKWTWIADSGHFITNAEIRESQPLASDTKSDSVTVTIFNLDKLNDVIPKVRQWSTWDRGLIPESPDSLFESLVQQVNRGRFHFELGEPSAGPMLCRSQAQQLNETNDTTINRSVEGPYQSFIPNTLSSNWANLEQTFTQALHLGPDPQSPSLFHSYPGPYYMHTQVTQGESQVSITTSLQLSGSRKRFKKDFGKFGRNLH